MHKLYNGVVHFKKLIVTPLIKKYDSKSYRPVSG